MLGMRMRLPPGHRMPYVLGPTGERPRVNTEADTCRLFVVPRLQAAGWDSAPHAIKEQRTFTDGRVIFVGGQPRRGRLKRADYLLRYRPDYALAVVEASPATAAPLTVFSRPRTTPKYSA